MLKRNIQKSGWKISQSKKQLKKKTKLAVLILALIFSLIILGQIVNFGRMFFKPWNFSQTKISKNYHWNSKYNINLVVKAKSLAVLSLNPTDKTATIINFPDNTLMDTAFGFGKWQIRSIYNLGQSDGNRGYEVLEQSLSLVLGVPIDGLLEFKGKFAGLNPSEIVSKFNQNFTSGITDIKDIQTDLTLLELVRLKLNLAQVRFDKIKDIKLTKVNVLNEEKMNDGTPVYVVDPDKIDQVLVFIDPLVQKEHLSIAVFNATEYPQLAQKAARLITNLGGNVIVTANTEKAYAKTQVIGKIGLTLTRLNQMFDLGCSKDSKCVKICQPNTQSSVSCVKDTDVENSRAQINVVLGEDFYSRQ